MRCKQEEFYPVFVVKFQYLCHNGKWRIIYNNIRFLVCFCLIISIRHKRSHKILLIKSILFRHIICDRFINDRGCIAVIGCFLCFKLRQKFLIFFIVIGKFATRHSFLKLFLFLFVCVGCFIFHNFGFFLCIRINAEVKIEVRKI